MQLKRFVRESQRPIGYNHLSVLPRQDNGDAILRLNHSNLFSVSSSAVPDLWLL